jgi:pimeloyl-ACP methyl ester carboxylesterase
MRRNPLYKPPQPHSQDFLRAFAAEGIACSSEHLPLSTGVSLLISRFTPDHPGKFPAVVFIPGLLSGIENFKYVLREFTRDFTLICIDTREKNTSLCQRYTAYTIPVMASDIIETIATLGLKEKQYILMGYSMSASIILEGFHNLMTKPAALVVVNPTLEFRFPRWSLWLSKFIAPFYGLIKPLLKLYIGHFHVNRKEDPEMHRIQSRVLDAADPRKLCATVSAIASYTVWDRLAGIDIPLLVIGASKDSLHHHDDALRLASRVKNSCYIDLETNERSHGGEVAKAVRDLYITAGKP